MKKLLLPILFLNSCLLFSQAPTIQWQKSLGGSSSEYAFEIAQTADNGYVAVGYSKSTDGDLTVNHGQSDYWVIKLDTNGTIQWQKSYGGTGSDEARCVKQTNDGGYIIAGISNSNNGDVTGNHGMNDYWITKLSSTGVIQWQKSYGGTGYDEPYCIQKTTDGGYIVAGFSESNDGDVTGNHGDYDYWLLKLDSAGTIQWQKSLGGTDNDKAFFIQQTNAGGYLIIE